MSKVIASYRIYYPKYKVGHNKNLVSHDDYINEYKVKDAERIALETEATTINRKKHLDKYNSLMKKASAIKKELKEMFGSEWFTDKSPLWMSQFNGGYMDLGDNQGGKIEVMLQKNVS